MRLVVILLMLISFEGLSKEKLKFLTAEYCPLVCDENKGLAIDLAKKLASESGHELEIKIVSIARAFDLLKKSDEFHGIILGDKGHIPNTIFMKHPIFSQKASFFSRKSLNWKYEGIKSLKGKRIAFIKNFDYKNVELMQYLNSSPDNATTFFDSDSAIKIIKMLELNRVDIFIAGDGVAKYLLKKEGKLESYNHQIISSQKYSNYISFSKNKKMVLSLKMSFDQAFEKLGNKEIEL